MMSNNTLPMVAASAAIVITADILDGKSVSAQQVIGGAILLFGMSVLNTWNGDLAGKFALLILAGVTLTKGYSVMQKVGKML